LAGTEVTWLELARQMLDDPEDPEYTEGVVATLEMLDANRQIHTARLGENRLGPAHAAVLAPALNGGSGLSRLLVDGNQFGAEGASALAAAIGSASAHIIELDLALNDLGDDGCIAIGKALVTSPSVTILSLEGNAIGAAGGEALKEAMAVNTQLERLVMRLNKLASAGVSAIAEGLSANAESGLLSVDFFGNSVGDSAVVALGAALQQPGVQLQELGLAKNNIGNDGAVALAEALQSRGGALPLRTLVLAANSIGDKGAAALLAAVKANAFLTTLDVRQHSTPSMKNLMKQVRQTPFLSHVYIKTITLPRQARDKHRGNSTKRPASSQVKPELACNAVLEQATGWESAADRVAVYKLVTQGQKQVEEIAKNWKPSVYRLGPTKPQPQSLGTTTLQASSLQRETTPHGAAQQQRF
jgi:Ran GTPase-activating protein (RanGAP) involved in mRNA processing and transport